MTDLLVLAARDARGGLERALAGWSAHGPVPAPRQILVLDLGSTDGLGDWLRLRWPGVEVRRLEADAPPEAIRAAAGGAYRLIEPDPVAQEVGDLVAWAGLVAAAVAGLPRDEEAAVLLTGLGAGGGLDLLGLAVAAAQDHRRPQATDLAELSWVELAAAPPGAPLLAATPAVLDAGSAALQLGIEHLLGRAHDRPVRLVARGLAPSPPRLLSRLLDALLAHPDAELWVQDAVSLRYGRSLLGPARVRLVPPPPVALLPALRAAAEHELIPPELLEGEGHEVVARLGLPLAGVLGVARALRGPTLRAAWAEALIAWTALRRQPEPLATAEIDRALLAAAAGRAVIFGRSPIKAMDLARTWESVLAALGITLHDPR